MKCELRKIDWNVLFHQLTADESWTVFRDKLEHLEEMFITVKTLGTCRTNPLWMTQKPVRVVRKQRKVYTTNTKILPTRHMSIFPAQKKAKAQIKKAKKEFEKKLAKNIGHIRFPISLPLKVCLHLVPFSRYNTYMPKI